MNWKTFTLRFLGLIALAVAGFYALALVTHLMIFMGMFTQELVDKAFGVELLSKAMVVLIFTFALGFIAIFLKEQWRLTLYFAPLYGPSLFGFLYTIMQ